MTQEEALLMLKTGANVFLTGEPGSGKTHTVNRYVAWLREHGIEPAITAATGIAATHIGGMTIHSWSGIGIKRSLSVYDLDALTQNKRIVHAVRDTTTLIIDEISMLSASTLDMVERVCREIRESDAAFGGLQVILVGDFFQLPPVTSREPIDELQLLEEERSRSSFAFDAQAWSALSPLICYLSEQHRQEDAVFLDLLSAIRAERFSDDHRALLESRYAPSAKDVPQLYSHNANADAVNDQKLALLPGEMKTFAMESRGTERLVETLKRGCLSPERLLLKVNAKVMFTKNDIMNRMFANGTLGTVTGFADDGMPIVTTRSGRVVEVEPMEWSIVDGGRILAQIFQLPLRLAWAMTIHKSQGMSLDAAHMDLSSAFEYGQGYVALSRVRTLEGLSLGGFNERALEVHPEIVKKDIEFRESSDAAAETFEKLSAAELEKMHGNFIHACGGTVAPLSKAEQPKAGRPWAGKHTGVKITTRTITKELLLKGMSAEAIAKERSMTLGTIISHLEALAAEGAIDPATDLASVTKDHAMMIGQVHEALRTIGHQSLTEIFKHLKGKVSYDMIRLAKIFYREE